MLYFKSFLCSLSIFSAIFFSLTKKENNRIDDLLGTTQMEEMDICQEESLKRKSITFIMGEDEKAKNQYYAEAKNFYRYNESERTDWVVDTCRSLWSIHQVLKNNQPENGLPWGKINIVVHSNEWTGLSMPLFPNGERINAALLRRTMEENSFKLPSIIILDEQTEIHFQSCGLGRNQKLMEALKLFYGENNCPENAPSINSAPYFVFYESEKYNGIPLSTRKKEANVWYAFYKTGYREGDIKLSRQLKARYPDAKINWRKALKTKETNANEELQHFKFTIPIEWIVTYQTASKRPVLDTEDKQINWLHNQKELVIALEAYGITQNKFRWTFKNTDYTFEDGITEPAIMAKGWCTVVCILEKRKTKNVL